MQKCRSSGTTTHLLTKRPQSLLSCDTNVEDALLLLFMLRSPERPSLFGPFLVCVRGACVALRVAWAFDFAIPQKATSL